jgi:N-acetylmuramic acid 6-phosphate etherase
VKNTLSPLLSMLGMSPSPQSRDYVENKRQFQLHSLLTEQRHPQTWNLSFTLKDDIQEGMEHIWAVDKDVSRTLENLAGRPDLPLQAVEAVSRALSEGGRIFIYGCGSTGRLAKQLESALWRPFWRKIKADPVWGKLRDVLPEHVEDLLIGELTGGDRALISSLEGFEDLELMGELQLKEHGIRRGDVVFAVTEGGETSSVIGAVRAAREQYGAPSEETDKISCLNLYFVYNNPDDVLEPFDRSRTVLEHRGITKLNLTTGPQAITGSTRMQAATIETFLLGAVLETGVQANLEKHLTPDEMSALGFIRGMDFVQSLKSFSELHGRLFASRKELSRFVRLEADTYAQGGRAGYCAGRGLIPMFVDCAERSPTFHLFPLDSKLDKPKKSWLTIFTPAADGDAAWINFLGRPFRGLPNEVFRAQFEEHIEDPYLREAALASLDQAGSDQQDLYDFALTEENLREFAPSEKDLGVLVLVDREAEALGDPDSAFSRYVSLLRKNDTRVVLILVGDIPGPVIKDIGQRYRNGRDAGFHVFHIHAAQIGDPMNLKRQVLLKMLLNNHSTAVMARLGRVVGNTMTDVFPSNLKLIGRATYLIQSHVNDAVRQAEWIERNGAAQPVTYSEANAVLFDAMEFSAGRDQQVSEVALSIIRILESLRTKRGISWEEALRLAVSPGLERYMELQVPGLRRNP